MKPSEPRLSISIARYPMVRTLLAGAALLATGCNRAHQPDTPNIVLIVMDTVRADHLSSYGYERPTTPAVDAFAADAVRFEHAYSVSSWTLPSHASLFTGLHPTTHGANQRHWRLDERFQTLAEVLGAHGYSTAAFSRDIPLSDSLDSLLRISMKSG